MVIPKKHHAIKIVIGYPPIQSDKGIPLLSQNRQFQFFHHPTYIYPMLPAYAATQLKEAGYDVYWLDGIAEKLTSEQWLANLKKISPDIIIIETKSPVIQFHWQQLKQIKNVMPGILTILVGDHVTFNPYESFIHSPVDIILTGGDYDFLAVNVLNHMTGKQLLEGGIYWRIPSDKKRITAKPVSIKKINKTSQVAHSGPLMLKHNLDTLPFIDRDLTHWKLYAHENGNYKHKPATYMYSGRDCWWNRCTFCVWVHTLNPKFSYRSFSAERLFAEVKFLVDNYGVKEIFDDAGTFYIGPKLKQFCRLMIESGYNKKVRYGCNMRLNAIRNQEDYNLLRQAGFRFILFGMESANQKTLDKLDKGLTEEWIIKGLTMATKAGLDPHLTVMLGYPWESYDDAKRTIRLARECFRQGLVKTLQATIVIPYPGTPLWHECKQKGWLITEDYSRFDMREPVMHIPFSANKLNDLVQELYASFLSPNYIVRLIRDIHSVADLNYTLSAGIKFLGHMLDFHNHPPSQHWLSPQFWSVVIKKSAKHFVSSPEKPPAKTTG